ncbi:MAG TPA: SDR family oxidoreductase [Flavisolibacter sp.]|jgi:short-subunit dehydrogenase|nr:SDR family oxidoreductase [Flavisolibacter sp.]
MKVKDKVAVITGAGSGIGRAISVSLARRGCHLALVDTNDQGLQATEQIIAGSGIRISRHVLDVRDKEGVKALPMNTIQVHGGVDLLINNAGIAAGGTFLQMSEETFDQVMDVNFNALVRMTRAFLPLLLKRSEAQIVNISSVYGLISPGEQTAYSSSKFAVRGFTNALRHELENTTVAVTVVHPGGVATNIARYALQPKERTDEEINEGLVKAQKFLRMPPEKAGEIIVKGFVSGKPRILVGTDAKFLSVIERLLPVGYWNILKRLAK